MREVIGWGYTAGVVTGSGQSTRPQLSPLTVLFWRFSVQVAARTESGVRRRTQALSRSSSKRKSPLLLPVGPGHHLQEEEQGPAQHQPGAPLLPKMGLSPPIDKQSICCDRMSDLEAMLGCAYFTLLYYSEAGGAQKLCHAPIGGTWEELGWVWR